jgi:hypothetical protein
VEILFAEFGLFSDEFQKEKWLSACKIEPFHSGFFEKSAFFASSRGRAYEVFAVWKTESAIVVASPR